MVRVRDLRHTFGCRLRNKGVAIEDRQELLWHRAQSITTYYSAAELRRLLDEVNNVIERDEEVTIILRRNVAGF